MLRRILFIFCIYLLFNFLTINLSANTDNTIKVDPEKIIEGTTKIISGALSKVEACA